MPTHLQEVLCRKRAPGASREVINEAHAVALKGHSSPSRSDTHYWPCQSACKIILMVMDTLPGQQESIWQGEKNCALMFEGS